MIKILSPFLTALAFVVFVAFVVVFFVLVLAVSVAFLVLVFFSDTDFFDAGMIFQPTLRLNKDKKLNCDILHYIIEISIILTVIISKNIKGAGKFLMNVFERMLNTQALMFIYVMTGVIMAKTKILKHEGRSSFINLLLNITLPCMVLNSFNVDTDINQLIAAGEIIIIASICFFVSWVLGKIFWRNSPPNRKAVLEFATMFSNAGNAGMPIVASVFGVEGVFYASFFLLPARILIWTVGLSLFVDGGNFKDKLKILLRTPSLDVVFIGIALMFLPFKLPSVLSTAIKNIGDMTGPLSMMIIGAALGESNLKSAFDVDAFKLTAMRLIIQPLLFLYVLRYLGIPEILWQVTVILTAMPAAANTEIIAEMYGKDYQFAARCVVVSTIISLVSVPILTLLF